MSCMPPRSRGCSQVLSERTSCLASRTGGTGTALSWRHAHWTRYVGAKEETVRNEREDGSGRGGGEKAEERVGEKGGWKVEKAGETRWREERGEEAEGEEREAMESEGKERKRRERERRGREERGREGDLGGGGEDV